MSNSFALHLDFSLVLQQNAAAAEQVAQTLQRPSFRNLEVVRAYSARDESKRFPSSVGEIVRLIQAPEFRALSFESSGRDLVAGARLDSANTRGTAGATPLCCALARPVADDTETFILDACDLPKVLETSAGFLSIEPRFLLSFKLAVGESIPESRDGLSESRRVGRRARDFHREQIATKVAAIEWETFLGPGHLSQVDLGQLRTSGAFHRVQEITPSLVLLQVTADPLDDLSGALENRLGRAREALGALLMDTSDVKI